MQIAHNEFPIPRIPPAQTPLRPPSPRFLAPLPSSDPVEPQDSQDTASSSQETNKENANPSSAPTATTNPPSSSVPSSAPTLTPLQPPVDVGSLPAPIAALLDEVTSSLTTNFPQYPPHTIQRLSELVLYPKQHYRSLTAYLHALDRVVHVTSGANVYPLPPAIPDMDAMSILANGIGAGSQPGEAANLAAAYNVGSDEALGGALLTPIPWLTRRANGDDDGTGSESGSSSPMTGHSQDGQSDPGQHQQQRSSRSPQPGAGSGRSLEGQVRTESTETIEGPNGMGSIETVSISVNGIPSTGAGGGGGGAVLVSRGVTQGELLRQEQRAGVVPVSQLARHVHAGGASGGHMGNGNGNGNGNANGGGGAMAADDSSPTPVHPGDEDAAMVEEQEIPHARGPEEIGAADMGPQPESTLASSYVVDSGSATSVELHGIDVERAVGRQQRPDSSADTTSGDGEQTGSSSSEEPVPRSPKREADVDMDSGPSKRIKEDEGEGEEGYDSGKESPKADSDGDVAVTEPDQKSTAPEDSAASGSEQEGKEDVVMDGEKEEATE